MASSDLTKQTKLSREEWNSIEVPSSEEEKRILNLITAGFADVNISRNPTLSLIQYMKMPATPQFDAYLYKQYFENPLGELCEKYGVCREAPPASAKKEKDLVLKKADLIRFENTHKHIEEIKQTLFEYILLELVEKFLLGLKKSTTAKSGKSKSNSKDWMFYYYTLHKLLEYKVEGCNRELRAQLESLLSKTVVLTEEILQQMVYKADQLIEKNDYLLKYADETLYDHQKQLFTLCKQPDPKLVLYIAPTGTGKTMSPLGLAEKYRVIFVCAARHVGLALAKAAISIHKKIAFAFGCQDAEDIRLHYYAAKEYTLNAKSGGIGKVDNSQGQKVEIIISDVQSYLPAMLYMLAFNPKENIILYWDEPTITMDYAAHELHDLIKKNWQQNLIPNIVLSSATLPQRHEIIETINDFSARFANGAVHEIISYDCKKTIPLINREGYVEMPHYLFSEAAKIAGAVEHCQQQKTLLRYMDLSEAIHFIKVVEEEAAAAAAQASAAQTLLLNNRYRVASHFIDLSTITMYNVKMFYLNLLGNIQPAAWSQLQQKFITQRKPRYTSTVNIVTPDAHTLTDGPTIFLADDVSKIAQFYIQSANIPEHITREIMSKIQFNRDINEKVEMMERDLEDAIAKENKNDGVSSSSSAAASIMKSKGKKQKDSNKSNNEDRLSPELKQKKQQVEELKKMMKMVLLNPVYTPNTTDHLYKHAAGKPHEAAFTCEVSEETVKAIMHITDIADYWKLLLMMGIGVFAAHKSTQYVELMKRLAQEHKLYMIIASTDYIYGTNYQMCHGYIGKDLGQMSQEKCIQTMGRVGRNKLQQDYSVRFRDNELLYKLFQREEKKPEVANMNRLFNSEE